jgi:hypothetical protein
MAPSLSQKTLLPCYRVDIIDKDPVTESELSCYHVTILKSLSKFGPSNGLSTTYPQAILLPKARFIPILVLKK